LITNFLKTVIIRCPCLKEYIKREGRVENVFLRGRSLSNALKIEKNRAKTNKWLHEYLILGAKIQKKV